MRRISLLFFFRQSNDIALYENSLFVKLEQGRGVNALKSNETNFATILFNQSSSQKIPATF